ncbi:MAG: hypothetical protein WBL67_03495 [Nitrososphaeraceae archaeon]
MKIDLLSSATVVDRVVKFVDRNENLDLLGRGFNPSETRKYE